MSEQPSAVDWATALRMADGDEELLMDLAEDFVVRAPEMSSGVRTALETGDADLLAGAVHRLRGSLGIFQAHQAFEYATEVEHAARQGTLADASAAVDALDGMVEAVRTDLRRRLGNRA